jgi:hypothetical protein
MKQQNPARRFLAIGVSAVIFHGGALLVIWGPGATAGGQLMWRPIGAGIVLLQLIASI